MRSSKLVNVNPLILFKIKVLWSLLLVLWSYMGMKKSKKLFTLQYEIDPFYIFRIIQVLSSKIFFYVCMWKTSHCSKSWLIIWIFAQLFFAKFDEKIYYMGNFLKYDKYYIRNILQKNYFFKICIVCNCSQH